MNKLAAAEESVSVVGNLGVKSCKVRAGRLIPNDGGIEDIIRQVQRGELDREEWPIAVEDYSFLIPWSLDEKYYLVLEKASIAKKAN